MTGDDADGGKTAAWERMCERLANGAPLRLPLFKIPRIRKPEPLDGAALALAYLAAGRQEPAGLIERTLLEQRVEQALDSFHRWLEPQLEEAFARGHDVFVTRLVYPEDGAPRMSIESMSWYDVMRWQSQEVPHGTPVPANWTAYRRPEKP